MSPRTFLLAIAAAVLLCPLYITPAQAQPTRNPYPSREVQLVVPNEPGGGLDLVARLLAKGLTPPLEQTVVVLNRSGASGNVGTASVARAEPDGHTLLLTGVGHLVSPLLHAQAGYEPIKDFEPIAKIASAPNVLVVHESLKGLSLAQLLADPRSKASGFAFASAGYGHSSQLAAEVFMARTGARWLHVPYRGTGPASRALVSGEVQLMFVPAGSVQTLLAGGQAHALAVAHTQRLELLPSTPTLAELGVTQAEFSQWYGLFAPAGTPEPVLQRLQGVTQGFVSSGDVKRQFHALGLEPAPMGRAEFAEFLSAQSKRLGSLVKNIRVEAPPK
jgi:tripartite-type tricarboxylate transporter receptor subunit TctC